MPKLKSYTKVHKEKKAEPPKPKIKSGVACTELKCKGEMMIWQPEIKHPEYPQLSRASCGKCGWRGWV